MGSGSKVGNNSYDYSFKILLIGDSGVGKSSLLLSFISNFVHDLSPTIGTLLCLCLYQSLSLIFSGPSFIFQNLCSNLLLNIEVFVFSELQFISLLLKIISMYSL